MHECYMQHNSLTSLKSSFQSDLIVICGHDTLSQNNITFNNLMMIYEGENKIYFPYIDLNSKINVGIEELLSKNLLLLSNKFNLKKDNLRLIMDIHGFLENDTHFIIPNKNYKIKSAEFFYRLNSVLSVLKFNVKYVMYLSCFAQASLKDIKDLKLDQSTAIEQIITMDNTKKLFVNIFLLGRCVLAKDATEYLNKFYDKYTLLEVRTGVITTKINNNHVIKPFEEELEQLKKYKGYDKRDYAWSAFTQLILQFDLKKDKYENVNYKIDVDDIIEYLSNIVKIDREEPSIGLKDGFKNLDYSHILTATRKMLIINRLESCIMEIVNVDEQLAKIQDTLGVIEIIYNQGGRSRLENQVYSEALFNITMLEIDIYKKQLNDNNPKIKEVVFKFTSKFEFCYKILESLYKSSFDNMYDIAVDKIYDFMMKIAEISEEYLVTVDIKHIIEVSSSAHKIQDPQQQSAIDKRFMSEMEKAKMKQDYVMLIRIRNAMEIAYSKEQLAKNLVYSEVLKEQKECVQNIRKTKKVNDDAKKLVVNNQQTQQTQQSEKNVDLLQQQSSKLNIETCGTLSANNRVVNNI